jgi:hypothetical protein
MLWAGMVQLHRSPPALSLGHMQTVERSSGINRDVSRLSALHRGRLTAVNQRDENETPAGDVVLECPLCEHIYSAATYDEAMGSFLRYDAHARRIEPIVAGLPRMEGEQSG